MMMNKIGFLYYWAIFNFSRNKVDKVEEKLKKRKESKNFLPTFEHDLVQALLSFYNSQYLESADHFIELFLKYKVNIKHEEWIVRELVPRIINSQSDKDLRSEKLISLYSCLKFSDSKQTFQKVLDDV